MIFWVLLSAGLGGAACVLYARPHELLKAPDMLGRVVAACGVVAGGCHLIWTFLPAQWQTDLGFAGNPAYLALGFCATGLAVATSRSARLDAAIRLSWRRIGAGLAAAWAADVLFIQGAQAEVGARAHLSDLPYVVADILILWGLVSLPAIVRSRSEGRQFWLDAVTVTLCASMVFLYLSTTGLASSESIAGRALLGVYFLGDSVLILGIAVALLRQRQRQLRRPLWLLATGLGFGTLTDISWTVSHDPRVAGVTALGFWVFLGAAGLAQLRATGEPGRAGDVMPRSLSMGLPYVVIGVAQVVLLLGGLRNGASEVGGLVGGALLLTSVVSVRQALTLRENMRLFQEQKERETEARLGSLVRNASDVILVVGSNLEVRYATPSLERVLLHAPETLVGSSLLTLFESGEESIATALVAEALRHPLTNHQGELKALRKDGSAILVHAFARNLADDPHVQGVVVSLRDIHERKVLQAQLAHQAFHDPLTDLANRALVADRLQHALARWPREKRPLAVLMLDIDEFKGINDSLGHAFGDRALTEIARRLLVCVRPADTVGRVGGDEFVVLLEDAGDLAQAVTVAERMRAALQAPFQLNGKDVELSASIGIALCQEGSVSADELLRNADLALYMAKERGTGRHVVFESSMHTSMLERFELGADLRRAMDRHELFLHFQPIVDLQTGRILGAEALVRWRHSERGTLLPGVFIGLAEKMGLIGALGSWVLEESCRGACSWSSEGAEPYVSVNVSPRQLLDDVLVEQVRNVVESAGLLPRRLVLEVTESVLLLDRGAVAKRLARLRALGVRIAIDDFGTGYSSLSQLRDLPVDMLKIDRSFVEVLGKGDSPLVQLIVQLGRHMNLDTVAEGIETAAQVRELRALGGLKGQGYFLARPMPLTDLSERLLSRIPLLGA